MTTTSAAAAALAASRTSVPDAPARATALIHAARLLLPALERGHPIDAAVLRAAMEHAVGASDSEGGWDWKSAYDACEAAAVLFLRKFGGAMAARAGSAAALLPMLARMARLLPSHTRRSVEGEELQQFSTPVPLALVASTAAAIVPSDHVLEPSAGTGLLAIFAELAGASLVLNELAETRAGLLGHLFPDVGVTRFDAARIDDHLDPGVTPTVVLMNPPFSALANVDRRRTDAALRHVSSALARLAEGGRLVAITQASLAPDSPAWREDFQRLQERGTVVFSAAIDGAVYARHGTTIETRLTVIDKRAAADATVFPASPGIAPDAATLLRWVVESVPPRLPVANTPTSTASMPTAARADPPGDGVDQCGSRQRRRHQHRLQTARPSSSPTRPSTGSRPREDASAKRSTRTMPCSRSASPARRRIRPGSCSPRRWHRSRRPSRPTGPASPHASCRKVSCPTHSSRASSTRARRIPRISPARGRWTPPSMSSLPRPTMPRAPCASGAAGSWATAPAAARAARSPASSSTTGSRAGAAPCGSPSPRR